MTVFRWGEAPAEAVLLNGIGYRGSAGASPHLDG
jgi:hypothetical protein